VTQTIVPQGKSASAVGVSSKRNAKVSSLVRAAEIVESVLMPVVLNAAFPVPKGRKQANA
jgi:hypothetical protein